jgi:hypothetical protein
MRLLGSDERKQLTVSIGDMLVSTERVHYPRTAGAGGPPGMSWCLKSLPTLGGIEDEAERHRLARLPECGSCLRSLNAHGYRAECERGC